VSVSAPERPPARVSARLALALIRVLTPVVGEPRAQWLVGRTYALLYLARYYLVAQYAKASLGVLWVALAPVLLAAVYLPVFLFIFKAKLPQRESNLDYALFALAGLMVWAAVQDALGQGVGALIHNASIVRHAPTPPAMLPVVKVLGAFAGLGVGLAIFVVVLVATGQSPGARVVLVPVAFALLLAATLGFALLLAVAAAYVRDVAQALPTVLAVEFFAAPIVYPLASADGSPWILFAIRANPLTPFLALARAGLLPWEPFAWSDLGLATAWGLGTLAVGAWTFRKLEAGLSDVL
jgi:ABC-type polysaccharide/polyol phosphate export permease